MLIYILILILNCFQIPIAYVEQDGRVIEFDNFDEFKNLINKSYLHAYDELRSRLAFEENQNAVRQHNELFNKGKTSYRLRTNIMADISNDSYLKIFLRLLRSKHFEALGNDSELVGSPVLQNTPKSVDWRKKGFKTQADNQRTCGSCYAFSIVQSIEGQVFKRTGLILKLSSQQVVDCSTSHGNQGCTGGSLRNTLRYLQDVGGLMLSKNYKYMSKKGKCQYVPELAVVNITSWTILQAKDEKSIEAAVAHIGPVAISINAKPKTFQLYSDGVYNDDSCAYNSVNHAMLVVGYTRDYWILKNWWGKLWGEDGYMRIAKGKNLCGIASYAAYAIV